MIQLDANIVPEKDVLDKLKEYQTEIDSLDTFVKRSEKAKNTFSMRNKIGNRVFDAIKVKLDAMCSGARRCVYCEDSVGDEVEHIHPKDLYPNLCFQWENYVYACGPCNGPKNNKFAVFRSDNNEFQIVNSPKGIPSSEPPAGEAAMINPRTENPLNYCILDFTSTFKFVPLYPKNTKEGKKADYTFNEVLRLNEREVLRKARQTAYINYKSRLGYYTSQKNAGVIQSKLDVLVENLKKEAHPTVWHEMKRQHTMGILAGIDNDLNNLFIDSPEALTW